MCCIFTCCGWVLDIIQKCWTFLMSCLISSAVCCVLISASMAGIALGYNYSLAEYVDLKETNVSVYLKRGMFDDEIKDEMNWRRAGHIPVQGHLGDERLLTGGMVEDELRATQPSRRRLDDSIIEADDSYKFEGNLMKLTEKPTPPAEVSPQGYATKKSDEIIEAFANSNNGPPKGSLEHLKALQGLINRKKAESQPQWTFNAKQMTEPTFTTMRTYYTPPAQPKYKQEDIIKVPHADSGRRRMHPLNYDERAMGNAMQANEIRPPPVIESRRLNPDYDLGPYRAAVPKFGKDDWKLAKAKAIVYPTPVVPQIGIPRPSRPTRPNFKYDEPPPPNRMKAPNIAYQSFDPEVRKIKNKLFQVDDGKRDHDPPRLEDDSVYPDNTKMPDYDEESGIPVRRKREAFSKNKLSDTTAKSVKNNDRKSLLTNLVSKLTTRAGPDKAFLNLDQKIYNISSEFLTASKSVEYDDNEEDLLYDGMESWFIKNMVKNPTKTNETEKAFHSANENLTKSDKNYSELLPNSEIFINGTKINEIEAKSTQGTLINFMLSLDKYIFKL